MQAQFLDGLQSLPIRIGQGAHAISARLIHGQGASPLEIAVIQTDNQPAKAQLRSWWKLRKAARPAPLLLICLSPRDTAVCGPAGEEPPLYAGLEPTLLEAICREALGQPDRHSALRSLRDALPAATSPIVGIRNEGLLATHELQAGARRRADWQQAGGKAQRIHAARNAELLRGLGFQIEPLDNATSVLRTAARKEALAVLLQPQEAIETPEPRFGDKSPISYALAVADRENLRYVFVLHGPRLRLYPTGVAIGVGRRGRTETWLECHLGVLRSEEVALLWLIFSAEALGPGGSLQQLLEASGRFAGDLATGLRDRIYNSVIPTLAQGLAAARRLKEPTLTELSDTYAMAMVLLFRALFVAYAEDKDLLPYRTNPLYQHRSLKTKAQELLELRRRNVRFDDSTALWEELRQLFRAVDQGRGEWGIPAYDGGLFSEDPEVSATGAGLASLSLPNTVIGPALSELLLVQTEEGPGPVDFRSLSVLEFGTIYEGLLESELSVAESDLAVDAQGVYRPCRSGEAAAVAQGRTYLHNASGVRKSSGTYFTKSFAVEHLLDTALEPALREHLDGLDRMPETEAGEHLFDFTVADLAMGSGHFLVAAVDRIERAFSGYLARRLLPEVRRQLESLRATALRALGPAGEQMELEEAQVLRRIIARRCVYGVDLNPVAVELSRLALWIHTFVPGLSLSLLDHNLVQGNSLVGIGHVEEARQAIAEAGDPLFPIDPQHLLGQAQGSLLRFRKALDESPAELRGARVALRATAEKIRPAAALFDIITGSRMAGLSVPDAVAQLTRLDARLADSPARQEALKSLGELRPFHFPAAFPEVFLRAEPGFDVILGNPPWQEATLEEDAFWARHAPGLRALPQREQEREKARLRRRRPDLVRQYERELQEAEVLRLALTRGPFPGMGTGDPDLYKAFCWRFWQLARPEGGRIGVVLPRSALSAKGSTEFRQTALRSSREVSVTMLLNTGNWVFDMEPRYTIGLLSLAKAGPGNPQVAIRGPYSSLARYTAGMVREPAIFDGEQVRSWNDTASLPLLPSEESIEIFSQLRKAPRLDLDDGRSWRARPHTELHATNDKHHMDLKAKTCPEGYWPVFKGESFDLWAPDTGSYYAWADPEKLLPVLQEKRISGLKRPNSPFHEFHAEVLRKKQTLSCLHPRIAFRDVSRATDSRTVRATLVPPKVFLTNKAPYLLWARGEVQDQAFLLGILCSLPLDWYARRFVEINLNFFILNPFPIPRPNADHPLRQRVVRLAARLACPDARFAAWAKAVGVDCGPLAEAEKEDHIHELDALAALLYGLDGAQLAHLFQTFHEGWDSEERLRATLRHFEHWRKRA